MTFDKQVEKAKAEKLKYRILRDAIFIILGFIFLIISIFMALNDDNKKGEEQNKNNNDITEKN